MKVPTIKLPLFICGMLLVFSSCNYLDVVPEGVSRLENAFSMRNQAIKYLYTCYSYMPKDGNASVDPALISGDEIWAVPDPLNPSFDYAAFRIARGSQNANTPLIDKWDELYQGIRDCNIFLENVQGVPDMEQWEKNQWAAEATFLKAYYHFYLFRMYGPIPIIDKNLPIDADLDAVKVYRQPVDSCIRYIVGLLDESVGNLPLSVTNRMDELGRITQPIALALKAKVLVTAASPLFNGNMDQATLVDHNGNPLFNQTYDAGKWDAAVWACKEAIEMCENQLGMELYTYPGNPQYRLTDTTLLELSLRNAFTEKWNSEIIWANTQSLSGGLQTLATPKFDVRYVDAPFLKTVLGVPLKIVEQFYTEHGVPIAEDRTWPYPSRYDLQTAGLADNRYVRQDAQTIGLHFNREPRFYAYVGFDAGIWYGQGRLDDANPSNLYAIATRKGQFNGKVGPDTGPVTGYYTKKYIHFENVQTSIANYTVVNYAWPLLRLSDLYLLYAEALNEVEDNESRRNEALLYVDKVRERAGLAGVATSWERYSSNPTKYKSQNGLRQIIQQERLIELCFEGQRFWDIRRWKTAAEKYNTPIQGWDLDQNDPVYFYRLKLVEKQTFGIRDYFWPIRAHNLTVNPNLVQNIGW